MAAPPTLGDVAAHLNITDAGSYDELLGRMLAAVDIIEGRVGPLTPREVVERQYHHGGPALVLKQPPVVSLTDLRIVGDGAETFPSGSFHVEVSGLVMATGHRALPSGVLQATYQSGRVDLPAALHEAVLVQTGILWASQRRASSARAAGPDQQAASLTPSLRRLEQLLADYLLVRPVVA